MNIVKKPYGEEQWIVNREYAGKKIVLYKNHRGSLHFHKLKDETFYIIKGLVLLELNEQNITLKPGDSILIKPYDKHRITGLEDSEIIEFSTHHYDEDDRDNYRLEFGGKISAEDIAKKIPIKKIYITGSKGFLGEKLMEVVKEYFITRGSDKEIDITSREIEEVVENFAPDILINAAAYADYKDCEENQDIANKVNVNGVENLLEICKRGNIKFVQISTDFVFDGKKGSYTESDRTFPINFYGKMKVMAEEVIASKLKNFLIIRTSTFYGFNKNNRRLVFVNKVIDKLSNGEEYYVATDEISTPTLIDDLARAIVELIKKDKVGIWNIAGKETLSRYDLALKVADIFHLNKKLIVPSTLEELGIANLRPKDCSLNITKMLLEGINMHTTNEGLQIMKEQIGTNKNQQVISSGVIVFHKNTSENLEILLIRNKKSGQWGFAKGRVENNETLVETAIREVKEEVGLELSNLKEDLCYESNYVDDCNNKKNVVYFIKEVKKFKPKLNDEIDDYQWVSLEKAFEILLFPELKEIIKKLKSEISNKNAI